MEGIGMTCIVGVQQDGKVWIGGDSAGVSGYSITARGDDKVFTRDGYAFGFTTSFRMGQILRYDAELPDPDDDLAKTDPDAFLVSWFIPAVRTALTEGGYTTIRNSSESGGTFLLGMRGRLYSIESDFQIGRSRDNYMAVGCGDDLALGSLHTTSCIIHRPEARVMFALEAATHHSAGVAAPYTVVSA
jgi:hypothetical protein